jgi:hypothetical protein
MQDPKSPTSLDDASPATAPRERWRIPRIARIPWLPLLAAIPCILWIALAWLLPLSQPSRGPEAMSASAKLFFASACSFPAVAVLAGMLWYRRTRRRKNGNEDAGNE